jgi:hypothetical protein
MSTKQDSKHPTITSKKRKRGTGFGFRSKKQMTTLPSHTHLGDEWMTAGLVPIRHDELGWEILAVVETKGKKTVLSPLKGKREVGEETPGITAVREFNEESEGAYRPVTADDINEDKRIYIKHGKMLFYYIKAIPTDWENAVDTPKNKHVVWVPIDYNIREAFLETVQEFLGLTTKIKAHFAFTMVASHLGRMFRS